jgi:cysteinyl-tRNA synthetase
MSQSKEELVTLEPEKVKLYTCGLTVYSQPHIGNWVAYIYWDLLVRTLTECGYVVERVQNITDVGHLVSDDDTGEDKMEKGARIEGVTAWEVADKYIDIAQRESELLKLIPPNKLIRATDLIQEQIKFVQELEAKGFTYIIDDGVYFDTSKLSDYGKLARLDIEGLRAGERVDIGHKRNPTDFALWKLSPKDTKRDMEWESPWGVGFPGWHLECSVIARQTLGDQIDIHTGGIDHIPVHHTNEIAQTESVTGKQFSRFWIHGNHIKVNGTKISKSLGNTYTLQDIIDKGYTLDAFKLMVLSKHYLTEGNFTWEILQTAQNRLNNWRAVADLYWQTHSINTDDNEIVMNFTKEMDQAISDDLNSPKALMIVDQYLEKIKSKIPNAPYILQILDYIDAVFGISLHSKDITDAQKSLIKVREQARGSSDWSRSDEIRDQLRQQGIELNDGQLGVTWRHST